MTVLIFYAICNKDKDGLLGVSRKNLPLFLVRQKPYHFGPVNGSVVPKNRQYGAKNLGCRAKTLTNILKDKTC